MIDILAAAIIWLTGPVPLTVPVHVYTCTTDQECYQECVAVGDDHCDDMMWGADAQRR